MIALLRFVGVATAAAWLGGSIFYITELSRILHSSDFSTLLQAKPYFLEGTEQLMLSGHFHFQLVCALIAWSHLLTEWLYLGRPSRRLSFALLTVLSAWILAGGIWLQPQLKSFHETRFRDSQPATREAAARSFRRWHAVAVSVNVLSIGGLFIYLWRAANPAEGPRFQQFRKFRG